MARLHKPLRLATGLAVFLVSGLLANALQQPQPPVPPPDSSSSSSSSSASSSASGATKTKPKRYSHANDFLIRGTVFNEKALSLPGAELRVRRSSDKKPRWQTVTNSRGEFAVRVPQGAEYEMIVHRKGYADQSRTISAKNGGSDEGFVFRMEPLGGKP